MKINYRPAAINDMQQLTDYIKNELKNPSAGLSISSNIQKSISHLKFNPQMGSVLNSRYEEISPEVRFIIVNKQLVFYEVHKEYIKIIRILDGSADNIARLFE